MNPQYRHLNVEDVLVSILLNHPDKILSGNLEARWFANNRALIEAMQTIAIRGDRVDVFSVSTELKNASSLDTLIDIQKNPSGAKENFERYLVNVRKQFEAREVIKAIQRTQLKLTEGGNPATVLAELITEAMQISNSDGKRYVYDMTEGTQLFINNLEDIQTAQETGGLGLKTGIKQLDKMLGGLQPSDMTIVGARPGVGKSAFGLSVLRTIAKTGKRVGFFSTEMSIDQVMNRLYSLEANINAHKLRDANLDASEYARLTVATHSVIELNNRICDKPSLTIGELMMQARAWAADGGLDFIVVDYLTRLHPNKPEANQNLTIAAIVSDLKNLARTLNIPVMVLAQLNRSSEKRADKQPNISDLRDSGVIEQEADQILLLDRSDNNNGMADIIVGKNRHGPVGFVKCSFDAATMLWRDFGNG
jgi:replicative DNA helicase